MGSESGRVYTSLYENIPCDVFWDRTQRLTISALVCVRGELLLLRSSRAEKAGYREWWMPLQEGVRLADGSLIEAFRRGMFEELTHMPARAEVLRASILGEMRNDIPTSRKKNGGRTKHIVFCGVQMRPFPIRLNHDENGDFAFVKSWDEFDAYMAEVAQVHREKYVRVRQMVVRACDWGFLPWGKAPRISEFLWHEFTEEME